MSTNQVEIEIVNTFSLGCFFLMLSSFSFLIIKWVIYNIKTPKYPLGINPV